MKFVLNNKTFDGFKVKIPKTEKWFELRSFGDEQWVLMTHEGDVAEEIYTFTKQELKLIWLMLTVK